MDEGVDFVGDPGARYGVLEGVGDGSGRPAYDLGDLLEIDCAAEHGLDHLTVDVPGLVHVEVIGGDLEGALLDAT